MPSDHREAPHRATLTPTWHPSLVRWALPRGRRRAGALAVLAALVAACRGSGSSLAGSDATSTPTSPTSSSTKQTSGSTSTTATGGARAGVVTADRLALPARPEAVELVLLRVERALRTDGESAAALRDLGIDQQVAYRALSVHPDWVRTVLAALPADLAKAVAATVSAGAAVGGLTEPARALPVWKIVTPLPVDTLMASYREAESLSGIAWQYFAAIHFVETRVGRIVGPSTAGAQGPMQFLPSTWAEFGRGGDIYDAHDAILAAARFLLARGGPANLDRALFSYNPDRRYVDSIEGYASVMLDDARAYAGYHAWQVYYSTADGTFLLPEGYPNVPALELPPS